MEHHMCSHWYKRLIVNKSVTSTCSLRFSTAQLFGLGLFVLCDYKNDILKFPPTYQVTHMRADLRGRNKEFNRNLLSIISCLPLQSLQLLQLTISWLKCPSFLFHYLFFNIILKVWAISALFLMDNYKYISKINRKQIINSGHQTTMKSFHWEGLLFKPSTWMEGLI